MVTVLDARGLLCPLPVLRLRKQLLALPQGAIVRLIATDRMAMVDVPHFCEQAGHVMVGTRDLGDGALEFTVRRGPSVPQAEGLVTPEDS
ncbi:MAG: sulfurtransferase TusA family protein [Paracoccus sp.]|uniref:Sulfurtransferase TusA family protein n=1 Tax=Paracoccus hibiscisoli TaxID=2023261 RepID=A0A4U0QUA7_9RHOB|nr:sulfurtransferase TusA family protein [Paracoccus hibiscisoli]MCG6111187.1 sulfurtransferase TusA family protein [Paracoccus sp. (in: a-proteobacteria)]TJZ85250.1 sulfurtransferase TusA family protein [Paracoccus hibiscisoli]